eukprot:TRINITY_DN14180_c0_g1_i1.p1 TRINITY_DN14180_c0_g1~~TRINITY_DN14180_c0_g1_i1.p1  ORF type:complete len:155 (-),score=33.87 TRINITY_DN14180_c0_g1_i1:178-642(-)
MQLKKSPMIVLDGNFPKQTMREICELGRLYDVPVWYEPTSVHKATRIVEAGALDLLSYISPNRAELVAIANFLGKNVQLQEDDIEGHKSLVEHLMKKGGVRGVVAKLGAHGVLIGSLDPSHKANPYKIVHYEAPRVEQIISVTGAGDSLAAGIM